MDLRFKFSWFIPTPTNQILHLPIYTCIDLFCSFAPFYFIISYLGGAPTLENKVGEITLKIKIDYCK